MIKQLYHFLHPKFRNLFLEYNVDFKPRYGYGKPPHPELLRIIEANRGSYKEWIEKALALQQHILTINDAKTEPDPLQPVWNNGFLPGLDIVMLYTLITECKPKRYVEIGSGNSTKVAYKAKKEQSPDTEIISIDPKPRAEIDAIANEIVRTPFENINYDITGMLQENDILFVDNSHRILPNSDSMVFFLEILPRLKTGVIVHIHDVYLPFDYPQFMCNRFYSEQYGLAICLLANPQKYHTLLPNYFISQDTELSQMMAPFWDHKHLSHVERHGGSFWMRIQN